jgi:hypothetical protein
MNKRVVLISLLVLSVMLFSTAAPAFAEGKAYGKDFKEACGATWGEIVSQGQPRDEGSAHYRQGYKGGVQGIMNNLDALLFHANALCPGS